MLATFDVGNALPAYAPVVVYLGHGPETAYADRKKSEVEAFYRAGTSDVVRQALVREAGIEYVVFDQPAGPSSFDPATAAYLKKEFTSGDFSVYSVQTVGGA